MSEVLTAALAYAEQGMPVFPCRPVESPCGRFKIKSPMTTHGFKDATTDPHQITGWWTQWPAALIGMPTGMASGIDVLDIDTKRDDGYAGLPDWESRSPVIVKTPSGGAHLWYKSTGRIRNTADAIAPSIDTRGDGGYAIVPPSRMSDGSAYTFEKGSSLDVASLPPFPLDLAARLIKPDDNGERRPSENPEADPSIVAAALEVLPNDNLGWEDWNTIAMAAWRATDGAGFEAFDTWSRKSTKYNARDTADRWRGITKSPPNRIGAGSIFFLASDACEESMRKRNQNAPLWRGIVGGTPKVEVEDSPPVVDQQPSVEVPEPSTPPKPVVAPQPIVTPPKPAIVKSLATPFTWVDPKTIPVRAWLYKPHYVRKYCSLTVAAGGIGKSSLVLVEALAMASGKPLLGPTPEGELRVWYVNLEDPLDELQRRIAAACKHYAITPADIGDRLYVDSGRLKDFVIVEDYGFTVKVKNSLTSEIIAAIKAKKIDVLIVDPLVSSHTVPENDNTKMGKVAGEWADIADMANCSVQLVHHARKTGGERASVDDGRGASALLAAVRSARVCNTMDTREAEIAEIVEHRRRYYFRSDVGKANLAPPAEHADWYELKSVDLENGPLFGDLVGVVVPFKYPMVQKLGTLAGDVWRAQALIRAGGPWRLDGRSTREPWVGEPIAKALCVDLGSKATKRAVAALVKDWLTAGHLVRVEARDGNHDPRVYVEAMVEPEAAVVEPADIEPRPADEAENDQRTL